MSQNHSACIPPPSDYSPRARPPQTTKHRDRQGGHEAPSLDQGQSCTTFQDEPHTDGDRILNRKSASEISEKEDIHKNQDDRNLSEEEEEEEREDDNDDRMRDSGKQDDEDEEDPLDAYMKSLENDLGENKKKTSIASEYGESVGNSEELDKSSSKPAPEFDKRGVRLDIDDTDDIEESYYQYVEQTRGTKKSGESVLDENDERQDMVEYDRDGNIISVRKVKKEIDPLPAIDLSTIDYKPFNKIFYQEHAEIKKLTPEQGEELRSKIEIKVSGDSPPKPVCSFAHFNFDEQLMRVIRRSEYTQPTPIQAQAIPAALLGRNIIGIAMTGSGKTAAYLWPMIVHIMGQPDLKKGDGPIGLVLVPTRELALQVYSEAKKFSNSYKIAVVCAYGGGSRYEQSRDLEAGAEIVVATPGRMIDLIKMGVTNLNRVTYLVLDEADRFFEMGFEAQVRSICDHIRPDRQTLLFSATFKKKIEHLARTVTDNPIKIVQKALGEANEDVTQHVIVLPQGPKKWDWLTKRLVEFTSAGSVLIFVTRISNSEELHNNLKDYGKETLLLHGDMEQSERNRVITSFKRKEKEIMIATDVAARGLDISHIRTVINYDVARDIDTHIHRVGRTGRAGSKGDAYTLITEKDKEFAGHLVKNLECSHQDVGEDLMKLAMQSHSFRKARFSKHHHHSKDRSSHHHGDSGRSGSRHNHDSSTRNRYDRHRGYGSDTTRHNSSNREQSSYQSSDSGGIMGSSSSRSESSHRDNHNRKRSKWH